MGPLEVEVEGGGPGSGALGRRGPRAVGQEGQEAGREAEHRVCEGHWN